MLGWGSNTVKQAIQACLISSVEKQWLIGLKSFHAAWKYKISNAGIRLAQSAPWQCYSCSAMLPQQASLNPVPYHLDPAVPWATWRLKSRKSSLPQAQPPNLCCLSTGPIAVASMQLGVCWPAVGSGFCIHPNQVQHSPERRYFCSSVLLQWILAEAISGENKTKLTVREEGKELVKLCCWNRNWESYVAGSRQCLWSKNK